MKHDLIQNTLYFFIDRHGNPHNQVNRQSDQRHSDQENDRQFRADGKCHHNRTDDDERRTQEQTKHHVDTGLRLVDIAGHTGDQCRCSDLIQFIVTETVNVSKQRFSQCRSKSHRRFCSKILRRQGTYQSQHAQSDHQCTHPPDVRLVPVLDTDIDDVCHNNRNQQFKTGFQHFKQRCDDRLFFIRFQILKHLFHLRFPPALLRFSEEPAFSGTYRSASADVR